MSAKISVLMPVWNAEKYLGDAVDSILAQSLSDFELIVIDDGSTDGTVDILNSYRDPRIKIHQLAHGGIVRALNAGVGLAQSDWIARHDADDISSAVRLAHQWEAVRNRPDAVLCFSDISFIGEKTEKMRLLRLPRTRALIALRLCFQCPITHSTVMFKKSAFFAAGGYVATERHAEDYALWGRMIELGEFIALPESLVHFRIHAGSVSKQNLETQKTLTRDIAASHCARFMRLGEADAIRAAQALRLRFLRRENPDWLWFLTHCAPRLRWWSAEAFAWLTLQTAKRIFRLNARRAA